VSGIYLGLGANLGDRRANLAEAIVRLAPDVQVEAVSALYESPPQAPAPPPDFLNCACRVTTALSPVDLMRYVKQIEVAMGRDLSAAAWSPRPIDIDILLYEDQVLETPEVTAPHPLLPTRSFVLQPLLDIDPELTHPATGERLDELLRRIGLGGLVRVAEVGWQIV
jgi:2-amino-4-hydroxy-6-hydroxymethyldihydropteridine diphosphokinase